MKQKRGEQRYHNNVAYSNDDNGTGIARMKVNKSVESLKRVKQGQNNGTIRLPPNDIKLNANLDKGDRDRMPKINSTYDISKGLNFGHKFVKTKNKEYDGMEYGSNSLINIKDSSQMMDTSINEENDHHRSEMTRKKKSNVYRMRMKGSPRTE